MTKTYYHATPWENFNSIWRDGLRRGMGGVIYLADTPQNACRFLAIRGIREFLIVGVDLEEELVDESFDHSEAFFKCKAYTYDEDIPAEEIVSMDKYEI